MQTFGMRILVTAAALLLFASRTEAQVFTPTFFGPGDAGRFGVFLVDWGELGVEGVLRSASSGSSWGVRGGLLDSGDDVSVTIGADLQRAVALGLAPLRTAFTLGAQAIIEEESAVGVQAGLNLGATLVPGEFTFSPYVHPRVGLINGPGRGDEVDLELLADVGFNFGLSRLTLHVGASLSDVGADWGIGVSTR